MVDRSTIFDSVQLGLESTGARGVAVPANRILQALNVEGMPELGSREIRARGNKLPSAYAPGRRSTTGSITESAAVFGEICYVLESVFGVTTPTTPDTATLTRDRRYKTNPRAADTYQSYTVEQGADAGADRFTHAVFTGMTMAFTTEAINVTGDLVGQKFTPIQDMTDDQGPTWTLESDATDGTFTLTVGAQTTAGIDHDETSANILTALELLSNVGAGDITVSSGTLGTDTLTITIPTSSELWGLGTEITITDSTTGGATTLTPVDPEVVMTSLPLVVMDPFQVLITLDESYANLGTTPLLEVFSGEFTVGDKYTPRWVINRNVQSWKGLNHTAINGTLGLTMMADSQSQEIMDFYEEAGRAYCRIDVVGPEIEEGFNHGFTADMVVSVENLSRGDQDGAVGDTWGLRMVDDQPNDLPGIDILVRNDVQQL